MKLDDISSPIIKWTKVPNPIDNSPANAALMDYIDASIKAALNDRAGHFSSPAAYEAYKAKMRKEFNDRLLQLAGAK